MEIDINMCGDYIPFDIQILIMKRLPIKSLIKFTLVSKSWKSIIKSSEFIADYNRSSHIQPHRMFVSYDYQNYVDIFDDDNSFLQRLQVQHLDFRFSYLMGYSQGLFGFYSYENEVAVIWNPSIRKSVVIPVPERTRQTQVGFTVCNATDPMIFKIKRFVNMNISKISVEVFTLSSGAWRTLSNTSCLPRESLYLALQNVAIDKVIHWLAYDKTPQGRCLILSFDFTSEQFTELCLPPSLAADTSLIDLDLSKLKESLVVLQYNIYNAYTPAVSVWMMMEPSVQNSFRKLFTIKLPSTIRTPKVLGFRKNGQPIIKSLSTPNEQKLLVYEPDLECFNDIGIYGDSSLASSYMETLLLLDH